MSAIDDVVLDLTVHDTTPPPAPPSNRALISWLRGHKGNLHDRSMAHAAADALEGFLVAQWDREPPSSSLTDG